ncbi:MAG: sensor histidine kinase [Planctomycetaceae bacterium]|nr:sensor histidine kinase [Planctomycetaceae bacterium]
MSYGNSDRPTLEEQVQILTAQLHQAQKLTSLGELVGTTTHEFNNVLMTIINYAKLGMRCRDDATRDKALDKILAASQKAARITNSILGVARNRAETFEPTDLQQLVEDALLLLEREMNKYHITVDKQIAAVPEAMVNGNQIQQILLNLLINARQAMPRGGRILVKLDYDPAEEMLVLMIRDDGAGIPADKLPRIFDPFFSTKNGPDETGKGGTGLGLSSCRNIVEAHHGRIRVQSTVGKGTAFTILLPVFKSAQTAPAPPALGIATPTPATDHQAAP